MRAETKLLMPSLHYLKYEDASSGPMVEVLGYLGFHGINIGAGYKWNFVTKNHGLAIDGNVGLEPVVVIITAILLPLLPFALLIELFD